jgi:hypothetical protein
VDWNDVASGDVCRGTTISVSSIPQYMTLSAATKSSQSAGQSAGVRRNGETLDIFTRDISERCAASQKVLGAGARSQLRRFKP